MKPSSALVLLCAHFASSATAGYRHGAILEPRQTIIGGKVADPAGFAARRVELPTGSKVPGAKRVKIRSGPYLVPNMGVKNQGHAGMLPNHPDPKIEKPCEGDCTIVWQQAGLEYANGTNANIDSGLWLHHMVQFNSGPTRWDAGAWSYGPKCGPFSATKMNVANSERFFTSGNERTPFLYNSIENGLESGSGYHLRKEDKFLYVVELMNMNMEDAVVYVTMTYDYLEGELPKGWTETKPVWLDVFMCGSSEVRPTNENGSFSIKSNGWSPNFEGKILHAVGHVHDGGIEVDIQMAADKSLCKTQTQYAETPQFVFRGMSMGGDKVATNHISSMKGCTSKDVGTGMELKKGQGQSWTVKGHYDYSKRDGNLEAGKQSEIMVIGMILVAVPPGPLPRPEPVTPPKSPMDGLNGIVPVLTPTS